MVLIQALLNVNIMSMRSQNMTKDSDETPPVKFPMKKAFGLAGKVIGLQSGQPLLMSFND
jgi:hypothetical protein